MTKKRDKDNDGTDVPPKVEETIQELELTEITEGEELFSAFGHSVLKVVKGDKTYHWRVPINSIPHQEWNLSWKATFREFSRISRSDL